MPKQSLALTYLGTRSAKTPVITKNSRFQTQLKIQSVVEISPQILQSTAQSQSASRQILTCVTISTLRTALATHLVTRWVSAKQKMSKFLKMRGKRKNWLKHLHLEQKREAFSRIMFHSQIAPLTKSSRLEGFNHQRYRAESKS